MRASRPSMSGERATQRRRRTGRHVGFDPYGLISAISPVSPASGCCSKNRVNSSDSSPGLGNTNHVPPDSRFRGTRDTFACVRPDHPSEMDFQLRDHGAMVRSLRRKPLVLLGLHSCLQLDFVQGVHRWHDKSLAPQPPQPRLGHRHPDAIHPVLLAGADPHPPPPTPRPHLRPHRLPGGDSSRTASSPLRLRKEHPGGRCTTTTLPDGSTHPNAGRANQGHDALPLGPLALPLAKRPTRLLAGPSTPLASPCGTTGVHGRRRPSHVGDLPPSRSRDG